MINDELSHVWTFPLFPTVDPVEVVSKEHCEPMLSVVKPTCKVLRMLVKHSLWQSGRPTLGKHMWQWKILYHLGVVIRTSYINDWLIFFLSWLTYPLLPKQLNQFCLHWTSRQFPKGGPYRIESFFSRHGLTSCRVRLTGLWFSWNWLLPSPTLLVILIFFSWNPSILQDFSWYYLFFSSPFPDYPRFTQIIPDSQSSIIFFTSLKASNRFLKPSMFSAISVLGVRKRSAAGNL